MNESQIWVMICTTALNKYDKLAEILIDKGVEEFPVLSESLNNRNSLLHIAAMFGSPTTVRALLDAGANPAIKNDRGQTPLDVAIDNPETRALLETAMGSASFVERCAGGKAATKPSRGSIPGR